jgi:hypothetical protein
VETEASAKMAPNNLPANQPSSNSSRPGQPDILYIAFLNKMFVCAGMAGAASRRDRSINDCDHVLSVRDKTFNPVIFSNKRFNKEQAFSMYCHHFSRAHTGGWDYPMTTMTAARLGETGIAVDALLLESEKNRYLPNGHNWQRKNLPCY